MLERRHQRRAVSSPSPRTIAVTWGSSAQDVAPVIGRKHAAIDDAHIEAVAAAIACATCAMTGWPEVEPEWPNSTASGKKPSASATMACVGIGPNSPSIRRTSWPSSISGPPIASRPSGGRWSSGIRLPIDGMRHVDQENAHASLVRSGPVQELTGCRPPNRRSRRAKDVERFGEIFGPEIRPHPFGEIQFGVSALPEQEVGQSLLAAGPDDEIDVAKFGFAGDQPREAGAREFVRPAA